MFITYLRRELRRRMRQAIFIALGLALGIGLVITVTAASTGVKNAQAGVLHSLYGVGTDLTITQAPPQGSAGQKTAFGFQQEIKQVKRGQIAAGTKININDLANGRYAPVSADALAAVARQHDVTAAVGGLTLTDVTVTGTVPALTAGGSKAASNRTSLPARSASPAWTWPARHSVRSALPSWPPAAVSAPPTRTPTTRWWIPATRRRTS